MNSKEKSDSKVKWFFFVVFIPIVFTIILAIVILSFLGFSVVDKAKEWGETLPFVSEFGENEPSDSETVLLLEQKVSEQQVELDTRQHEIERKEEELAKLANRQSELEQRKIVDNELTRREKKEHETIAKTYEAMSSKNAAAIISELPTEEALVHISQISIEVRAKILAKMESNKAADLMSRLANE